MAPGGVQCSWCPWYRFCRGCRIQCSDLEFNNSATHLAVDWDPTALHLRYQNSKEKVLLLFNCVDLCIYIYFQVYFEHESVTVTRQKHSEPIGLTHCLDAFTREEQLSDDEKYFCSTCKERQPATKKLQIWRLPPILVLMHIIFSPQSTYLRIFSHPDCPFEEIPVCQQQMDQVTKSSRVSSQQL